MTKWVSDKTRVGGAMSQDFIEIDGIETNNLKAIDVKIPLYKLTAVTGVSGSGKSSLVFDTLYAEAYRRYVESLSSFARQYLKAMPKPKIGSIRHLPPAIAVQQSRSGATNRSTVGTLTEMHDILRVVFSQCGSIICLKCRRPVEKADPDRMARQIVQEQAGKRVLMAAPMDAWESIPDKELKGLLQGQGFSRVWVRGELLRLEEVKKIDRKESWVVADRVTVDIDAVKRLSEASSLILKLGRGRAGVIGEDNVVQEFSRRLECCGISYSEPTMALFSFNHPIGACETCQGFGSSTELNDVKIIPDMNSSLFEEGIHCWNFGTHKTCYGDAQKSALAKKLDVRKKKFSDYTAQETEWLWNGDGKNYTGIRGYFTWLDTKRYKAHYRMHAARFRKYVTCPSCEGQRLNRKAQAIAVLGKSIIEVAKLDVAHLSRWFTDVEASAMTPITGRDSGGLGIEEAILEARSRLGYLSKMGLSYLSLDRNAKSLSGGELQRINMSRCLGSVLTDTLFCLDEPTAGLHARDSENLLGVIRELQEQGNTVVVVEHERAIIEESDYFIEIGPKAGHEGGHLVFQGKPSSRPKGPKLSPAVTRGHETKDWRFFTLKDATIHNLKKVSVSIPAGKITAVCGVSGSGKTSLIRQSFFPVLLGKLRQLQGSPDKSTLPELSGSVGPDSLIGEFSDVLMVSQIALGRSTRSTIATYLDIMDPIRKIFSSQELAKNLGLTAGSFSFNSAGGRCETCRGLGTVIEDLSFLGEMAIICPACNGARFQESVLSVLYKGKNLIDVLSMTAGEARTFFFDHKAMSACLDSVIKVGMGYVTLGQSTSSFSGGEAQRLRLVQIMSHARTVKPSVLIFDEPTTGLSDLDVVNLFQQFKELSALGHTVIIVEHHLDVLRQADWLIEMGPEASEKGGEVVYQGQPFGIKDVPRSITRRFL
jgi:excinuclease ABC subunit A